MYFNDVFSIRNPGGRRFRVPCGLPGVSRLVTRPHRFNLLKSMADTEATLRSLASSLEGKTATATFTCGGTLKTPVAASHPLSLFLFYEDKEGNAHRLDFPASEQEMEHLSSVCEPATFGRNMEDVLDTEYRSAWKLDNTKFSCSLHPADYDAMEVLRRVLFPGAVHMAPDIAIAAELYKLNVHIFLLTRRLFTS